MAFPLTFKNQTTNTMTTTTVQFPNVFKVLSMDDKNMTAEDLIDDIKAAGLTEEDLPVMEAALLAFPEYIEDGLPFQDEDKTYRMRLNKNAGLKLLEKYMEFWH